MCIRDSMKNNRQQRGAAGSVLSGGANENASYAVGGAHGGGGPFSVDRQAAVDMQGSLNAMHI